MVSATTGPTSFVFKLLSKSIKIDIYSTLIQLVVSHGCETWSLTIREEHKLSVFKNRVSVFKNRVLRDIWAKEGEVIGGLGKLHSGELQDWYSSLNIIQVMK
jgi:hypothetical protein